MHDVQNLEHLKKGIEWLAVSLTVCLLALSFHGCATAPARTMDINTPPVEYAQ